LGNVARHDKRSERSSGIKYVPPAADEPARQRAEEGRGGKKGAKQRVRGLLRYNHDDGIAPLQRAGERSAHRHGMQIKFYRAVRLSPRRESIRDTSQKFKAPRSSVLNMKCGTFYLRITAL